MNFSEAALEATAGAIFARDYYGYRFNMAESEGVAEAALEAAAPHLLAPVWLEGYREGAMYGALGANGHEPPNQRNPYRSQA